MLHHGIIGLFIGSDKIACPHHQIFFWLSLSNFSRGVDSDFHFLLFLGCFLTPVFWISSFQRISLAAIGRLISNASRILSQLYRTRGDFIERKIFKTQIISRRLRSVLNQISVSLILLAVGSVKKDDERTAV